MMRALVIADRQPDDPVEQLLDRERPDLVLTLGDLQDWYLAPLAGWPGPKMGVYGNHCWSYMEQLGIINLHMSAYRWAGLTFAGFEGCNRYKATGRHQYHQDEASAMIRTLPAADVMICHSPPYGVNDHDDPAHQGLHALNWYVEHRRPRLLLHGHTYPTADTLVDRMGGTQIAYINGAGMVQLPA